MITVKTEGFEDIELALSELADSFRVDGVARTDLVMRNTVTKAAKRAMEPVAADVITNAPYDENNTGPIHLRGTVSLDARTPNAMDYQSTMVNQTDIVVSIVSVKKSGVSLSQEFGNAVTPAHPYLRNSLERNFQRVIDIFKSEMETLLPAYAMKLAKRTKKRK